MLFFVQLTKKKCFSESQQNVDVNDGNVVDDQQKDNELGSQQNPQQQQPTNDKTTTTIQEYKKDTNITDLTKHEKQQQQPQTDIDMIAEEDEYGFLILILFIRYA